jgi:L-histidine N-alpha-methyltransferase
MRTEGTVRFGAPQRKEVILTKHEASPTGNQVIDVARIIPMRPSPEECATLRESLQRPIPEIPTRYFYDDTGSRIFERITQLSAYYQTRTEIGILERRAQAIIDATAPQHIVELGSGAGRKIRLLFDAWGDRRRGGGCTLLDVNELFLRHSIEQLEKDYPGCRYRGVVGDFTQDLDRLEPSGHRLVVFFAGTIGNLLPEERRNFLRGLAGTMASTDTVLIGVDLVKERSRLEAAYNDPEGVTAAFNRNILSVLNRRFNANFPPEAFGHRAFYDPVNAWIEMRLVTGSDLVVDIGALGMTLRLAAGSEIRTEVSCKFTRESLTVAAAEAGLKIEGWYSDPAELFALALLKRRGL